MAKKILIVEDNEVNRVLMKDLLPIMAMKLLKPGMAPKGSRRAESTGRT